MNNLCNLSDILQFCHVLPYAVHVCDYLIIHHIFITLLLRSKPMSMLAIQSVLYRIKCLGYIGEGVLNSHLGSNPDPCGIQTVL